MCESALKLIVLKTNDVEALRAFYSRIGFRFVEERHGNGPLHFSSPLGEEVLEIYPLPSGTEADTTTRLGFSVTGIAAVADLGEVVSVAKQTEWGVRAIVRDPDGRTVELYESSKTEGAANA